MKVFDNPYKDLPIERLHRTTILVSVEDVIHITSVHRRRGTLQTTINILLIKLIERLKANGITSYDPDAYELAVGDCCLTIGQDHLRKFTESVAQPTATPQTAGRNDGHGTSCVAQPNPQPTDVAPDTRKRAAKKRVRKTNEEKRVA